jgi:two-component system, NarL family, nitrate/nitrite response regulator NarL
VSPSSSIGQHLVEEADVVVVEACGLDPTDLLDVLGEPMLPHRVILIVEGNERETVLVGAASGVKSFVPVDRHLADLVEAIRLVATASFYCPPEITEILLSGIGGRSPDLDARRRLTHRESEVMTLLAHGLSNKEIARDLGIAVATVKNHVHAVLDKLNARNRTEAIIKLGEDRSLDSLPLNLTTHR